MELRASADVTESPATTLARYLARLPLSVSRRREIFARSLVGHDDDRDGAMAALHAELAGRAADSAPAYASVSARLALAVGAPRVPTQSASVGDARPARLVTTPPLARTSMAPRAWHGWRMRRRAADDGEGAVDSRGRWSHVAARRRIALLVLILGQTWIATDFMINALPYHGRQPLEIAILALFAILFAWISAGFWTALAGFALLALHGDRHAITRTVARNARPTDIEPGARTAIVMPICNEDVARVFAGLRATYESLQATGALDRFDFFVLSDSGNADTRVAELAAWMDLCGAIGGFGRVFYRWRQHHIKRKSGNIADFCRRWGRKYRYMVILDADSVMTGDCLARLVLIAEANHGAGIIQTAPRAAGRDTFYARVQQFATGVYGPLFTAGLHYWQLGEAHYWGHNAIIRVAPFIKHCALGRLPGRGALSGEILSHDFVEAALMRRAGWSVWIAYDLPGSYEEMPPNLIDELSRDQRWCQGNLMNFRLFLMKGLHPAHRAVFMTGVMAYLSAPLWFLSLILATALLAVHTLSEPQYFVHPYQLFPLWPQWRPEWAVALVSATAVLLFLPKILAGLLVAAKRAGGYGGRLRLAASVLFECVMSALLAPIRMLFHTQFVVTSLLGRAVRWKSPPRADAQTRWSEAIRRHAAQTLLGIGWTGLVWWLNPAFLPWLLPVLGALIVSVPVSVYTSRVGAGRWLRARRFFLIPEETRADPVLQATRGYLNAADTVDGVRTAVVDPLVNALVCAHGVRRTRYEPARFGRHRLAERALREGVDALDSAQRAVLIGDPEALSWLHFNVWTADRAHSSWVAALTHGAAASGHEAELALSAPRSALLQRNEAFSSCPSANFGLNP